MRTSQLTESYWVVVQNESAKAKQGARRSVLSSLAQSQLSAPQLTTHAAEACSAAWAQAKSAQSAAGQAKPNLIAEVKNEFENCWKNLKDIGRVHVKKPVPKTSGLNRWLVKINHWLKIE